MNFNKHKAIWIGLIVLIVIMLGVTWSSVIMPATEKVHQAQAETAQIDKQNDALQKDIDLLNTASATPQIYKSRLAQLQREIPTSYNQSEFIASLDGAAATSATTIQSVSFGTAASVTLPGDTASQISAKTIVGVPVTITAQGGYDALRNFVDQVQRISRIAVPTSVSYSVADDDAQSTVTINSSVLAILDSGSNSSASSDAIQNAASSISK